MLLRTARSVAPRPAPPAVLFSRPPHADLEVLREPSSMMAVTMMERILIVDDHPLVRDGLKSLIALSFDGCEILEAASLDEAVDLLATGETFDLVMLDLHIPDVSRLDGLRLLRRQFPSLPIVMVSGSFDRLTVKEALAAGAAGFIPKSLKRDDIVEALQQVMAGEIFVPDALPDDSEEERRENEIRARIDSLTPQQKIVLDHLVQGRLNKQIAHELGVSMTTVKAHVSAILQKLGVYSRTQAVILATRAAGTGAQR